MPAPRIVAIGDNCVDVYPALGRVFPGGGAVNFAVHAARLGADAGYVGVVGDDRHGSLLRDALMAEGVDTSFVRVVPDRRPSATYGWRMASDRSIGRIRAFVTSFN